MKRFIGAFLATLAVAGCASDGGGQLQNVNGVKARDMPVDSKGLVTGTGIEGQDIVSMTNRMGRDLMAAPFLNGLPKPPRIIIDEQYFRNEGSQIINRRLITDRLRVELNRSSQGRLTFVGREYAKMVATERDLKRQGATDVGTTGMTRAQAGADYRLGGTISTLDSRDPRSGVVERYNQIIFEMIDLESGVIAWSGIYEFKRAAADDVIYR
ncbi:MAG: penicillin-binding protein activator LpoB [Thermoanaerobaculia bacterium]